MLKLKPTLHNEFFFHFYFSSPLVREFLSIDNPRNASVHEEDENETNGMNHENSESLVSSLVQYF